jgi:hypothetical protein
MVVAFRFRIRSLVEVVVALFRILLLALLK